MEGVDNETEVMYVEGMESETEVVDNEVLPHEKKEYRLRNPPTIK